MISRLGRRAAAAVVALPLFWFPTRAVNEPTDVHVPFGVGEKLEYDVKFSFIHVGQGSMEVVGVDSIRGAPAYHTVFIVKGGNFACHVDDRLESWIDTRSLSSLRFWQNLNDCGRERERKFEMFPERSVFVEDGAGEPDQPSVSNPLDDGSFLYYVRTVPLEVGKTYDFDRYFRPDRNPVEIHVLRKEHIDVPAGSFDAIVIQPVIKTKGLFSQDGHAEVWLSDDASRIMLQMKSRLSIGSLNLYLKSYRPAGAPTQ